MLGIGVDEGKCDVRDPSLFISHAQSGKSLFFEPHLFVTSYLGVLSNST